MLFGILLLGSGAFLLAVIGVLAAVFGASAEITQLYAVIGLALYTVLACWLLRGLLRMRRALQISHEKQRELSATSRHDPLTGLLHRAGFMHALDKALARWRQGGPAVAVLLVDIDRFRFVNDTHGHATGDRVLMVVGKRLTILQDRTIRIARLGGDEFALLIEGDVDRATRTIGQRILESLDTPIDTQNGNVRIGASIGLAIPDRTAVDAEAVLRAADIALSRAKRGTLGKLRVFEAGMENDVRERNLLEADLRRGLDAGEIVPYYQPLIALDGQHLIGFEVLARWQHPVRGIIAPATFIPLAEEIGRIGELFDKLLVRACNDARAWPSDLRLSVNISPTQFAEPQMAARILNILAAENFSPARLELEITENALVDEVSSARQILTALRNVGISVALDDFGTGYSSLRHLSDLPVDRLKIDRGFVEGARLNDEGWRIVRAIVQLASTFNLATTAEGIEEPEILSTLRELGCDTGQGYLFGRPISAEQTSLWLRDRTLPTPIASSAA